MLNFIIVIGVILLILTSLGEGQKNTKEQVEKKNGCAGLNLIQCAGKGVGSMSSDFNDGLKKAKKGDK